MNNLLLVLYLATFFPFFISYCLCFLLSSYFPFSLSFFLSIFLPSFNPFSLTLFLPLTGFYFFLPVLLLPFLFLACLCSTIYFLKEGDQVLPAGSLTDPMSSLRTTIPTVSPAAACSMTRLARCHSSLHTRSMY
jgi:hypothetical protein